MYIQKTTPDWRSFALTGSAFRLLTHLLKRRQQDRHQQREDGDHHQQFNQRKGTGQILW